jgi:hypothetical protein
MDMANNMEASAKRAFPKAKMVTDRFHVIKLVVLHQQEISHQD